MLHLNGIPKDTWHVKKATSDYFVRYMNNTLFKTMALLFKKILIISNKKHKKVQTLKTVWMSNVIKEKEYEIQQKYIIIIDLLSPTSYLFKIPLK